MKSNKARRLLEMIYVEAAGDAAARNDVYQLQISNYISRHHERRLFRLTITSFPNPSSKSTLQFAQSRASKMPDPAQINRSLSTIRTELEFLQESKVLSPPQFQSIIAQLPVRSSPRLFGTPQLSKSTNPPHPQGQNGTPSQYIDTRFSEPGQQFSPGMVAQQAQDPNNPAHPQNPKHHEWAKNMAMKFGNAAMFGAGATFGGDMVNDVLRKF